MECCGHNVLDFDGSSTSSDRDGAEEEEVEEVEEDELEVIKESLLELSLEITFVGCAAAADLCPFLISSPSCLEREKKCCEEGYCRDCRYCRERKDGKDGKDGGYSQTDDTRSDSDAGGIEVEKSTVVF